MNKNSVSAPSLEELHKATLDRFDWGVKALQKLISIDSISPHERECQEALADMLRAEDLPVELLPLDDGALRAVDGFVDSGLPLENRPNLVTSYGGGSDGGRSLLLNGHIDTVPWLEQLDKWDFHPLSGEIRDGNLFGRGAMDDKGLIMAAVMAILVLKDLGYKPPGRVTLTSVVGEEPSGNGTLALCSQGVLADAAIVLEATNNQVVYGHRGIIGLCYRTHGEARHASVGSSQANPIVEAGRLAEILDQALEGWDDPSDKVYGPPSVNVGRITGGNDIFTTPQECRIEYGVRYAPGAYEKILDHIEKHINHQAPEILESFGNIKSDVFAHFDAAEINPEAPLVLSLLECIQIFEPGKKIAVFPAGCDARHLINRYNVPTVVFGPSQIQLAHAENEYLNLDQWKVAIQELALFITRWCSGDPTPEKLELNA